MEIVILNGSPKGEESVTMQYINLWKKKTPHHTFTILPVAHQINKYEKDKGFSDVVGRIRQADGIVWAFPLYCCLVASQYKRFIELIHERDAGEAFSDKFAAAFSTSIHFFDHTAHNYIHAVSEDLGMHFISSFSADMDDILKDREREMFLRWGEDVMGTINNQGPTTRWYAPLRYERVPYQAGNGGHKVDAQGKRVLVLADMPEEKSNIAEMVKKFSLSLDGDCYVHRFQDIPMKGGCLGCMECAFDNRCVYRDGYREFFDREVRPADIIVFAGETKDRFLSSRVKMFIDRSFFNGHTPVYQGKQLAFLISGPLMQMENLREIIQAIAEISGAHLAGIVSDEGGEGKDIGANIDDLARRVITYARWGYRRPPTFLGVGGRKIFRDEIWARLRFPFQADYEFYLEHGLFDFPQHEHRYLGFAEKMTTVIADPQMREQVRKVLKTEMLRNYRKIVEKA